MCGPMAADAGRGLPMTRGEEPTGLAVLLGARRTGEGRVGVRVGVDDVGVRVGEAFDIQPRIWSSLHRLAVHVWSLGVVSEPAFGSSDIYQSVIKAYRLKSLLPHS